MYVLFIMIVMSRHSRKLVPGEGEALVGRVAAEMYRVKVVA